MSKADFMTRTLSATQSALLQPAVIRDGLLLRMLPLDCIAANTTLGFSIYVKLPDRFVLLRKEGDILSAVRIQSLRRWGVKCIFVTLRDWPKVLASTEESIRRDRAKTWDEVLSSMRSLMITYQREFEVTHTISNEQFEKLHDLGNMLAEAFFVQPALAAQVLIRNDDPDLYYCNHSVNVCVYSILMGIKRKLAPSEIRELGVATLLHNVGNIFTPATILHKREELSHSDWVIIKKHTLKGGNLLNTLRAPDDVILTAQQHHERIDGSGYPKELQGPEIHLFPRICSVADVFDALTSRRPYDYFKLSPSKAIERMLAMEGKFDRELFKAVAKIQG